MSEKKHYHRGRRRSSSPAGSRGSSRESSRERAARQVERRPEEDWENDWIDLEEDEDLRTPDGICPLLGVDGEPLREAEAGADE